MIPSKRPAMSPPHGSMSSRNSPAPHQPSFSPPYMAMSPPNSHRGMTTAAAAAAALKRSSTNATQRQNTSSSSTTAPASRQGSVETEREDSVPNTNAPSDEVDQGNGANDAADSQQPQDAEVEDDDENKEDLVADMDAHMQAQMEKAKEDMKLLLENFSEEQLQRYEAYRRSALNRTNVRRLVSQVLNQQCSQTMAIVVAGFSKVYVGEIIEKAREVMEEWGHVGAIRPEHLREAHRRYQREHRQMSNIGTRFIRR